MSKSVVFYQAHEDGMGCDEPKPYELTALLKSLEGLHCPVEEALADIRAAVPDAEVIDHGDFIHVGLGRHMHIGKLHCREFNYCAIKYMETP